MSWSLHYIFNHWTETMKSVWLAAFAFLGILLSIPIKSAPICSYGQTACYSPSLADLFDLVIQQSSRMFGISTDLHSDIDQYFPSRNLIGKQRCHTYEILTPDDKEKAQRLGQDELTEVILRLLVAWDDPLSQLYWSMSQNQNEDFNQHWSNKAMEISDMVRELKEGVLKVTDKMKPLVVNSNTLSYISPERLGPFPDMSFYKRGDLNSLDHHDLLYCFRRDSNKVRTYLGILKCSTIPELDC